VVAQGISVRIEQPMNSPKPKVNNIDALRRPTLQRLYVSSAIKYQPQPHALTILEISS
jgi:hypothetical protein